MKSEPELRPRKKGLPLSSRRLPGGDRILHEDNIRIDDRCPLLLKVLAFKTRGDLRRFWKRGLGRGSLGVGCPAATQTMNTTVSEAATGRTKYIEVDPRFFCVVGFAMNAKPGTEVITHESVHAAFAFYMRVLDELFWPGSDEVWEEFICYPTGRIAAAIVKSLRDGGLLQ